MLKFATAQIIAAQLGDQQRVFRTAHRAVFNYEARPGYLYVRSRAISSRCNDNWDEFPAEEIKQAYKSFVGKPVFVNHVNDNHRRARGVIIDAALHEDRNADGTPDTWCEVLMEVDAVRFPKLAKAILKKAVERTSMGCDVAYSICSACGNKATTPAEYCQHIPGLKGKAIYRRTASGGRTGEHIREICYGLGFFENSILVEPPADPTAHFLGVDDSGLRTAASKKTAETLSWDDIGARHPRIYGDPDFHGEAAEGADGWGIGDAANHLAHDRAADPGAEGSDVHSLDFHREMVNPEHIDYARHGSDDGRVRRAREGYASDPAKVPPLVLVHRHGVYQVADGHHRAEAAAAAGTHVPAYVAYSPHHDEPFSDGERAPYHGAEPHPGQQRTASKVEAANQEGGELPAFPWDKAPRTNLPMTQKGWDDPRRKTMYDAIEQRDMAANPNPAPSPAQPLLDRLPDHATSEMTNPYGMGTVRPGHSYTDRSQQPGDKREQWARDRWEQAHWPRPDAPEGQARSAEGLMRSKRNIRTRWNKWGKPLACEHNACPPWECQDSSKQAANQEGGEQPSFPWEEAPRVHVPTDEKGWDEPDRKQIYDAVERDKREMHQVGLDGGSAPAGEEGSERRQRAVTDSETFRPPKDFGPQHLSTHREAAGPAYPNPGDHPFFQQVPMHHDNILNHWDKATPEERHQGARWYPDAHLVAKSIAKLHPDINDDAEAAHKGGGVLSAYSPQTNWWANQHNAARSFAQGRAIGKGEGLMVMASHAKAAQRIMDGEDHQKVLKGPKTADFAHLIEHAGNDEHGQPSRRVVVDRHALSVAAGRRLSTEDASGFPTGNRHYYEHAAEQYRTAAAVIGDREGRHVPPHEVQAVTWLVRQRLNADEERETPGGKGRQTMQNNQRNQWKDLATQHAPELGEHGNSHVAQLVDAAHISEDGTVKLAYGETKAPADVDTLREENCPVCGDFDVYDGQMCQVCGFISPPAQFRDPNLDVAKQMDLRKQLADPSQLGEDGELSAGQGAPGEDGQLPPQGPDAVGPAALDENGLVPSPYGDQALDGTQHGPAASDRNGDGMIQPNEIDEDGNPNAQPLLPPEEGGQPMPQELPGAAQDRMGQPFTPGPNMPQPPGEPEGPEGMAEEGVPGTAEDGVPDLACPACGFAADATAPQTQNMGDPNAAGDGVVAGDVCPNCQRAQLMTPGEMAGESSVPPPAVPAGPARINQ